MSKQMIDAIWGAAGAPDPHRPIWQDKKTKTFIPWQVQQNNIEPPQLRIEFHHMTSINDYLSTARHAGASQGMVATLRKGGGKTLLAQAERQGYSVTRWQEHGASSTGRSRIIEHAKLTDAIFTRCKLIVRYWRPSWHRYDVFSPFIKPIVDGMVDVGLVEDDDQTRVRSSETVFMGIDESLQLSDHAKALRKVKRMNRKKSLPLPSRWWFDFYDLTLQPLYQDG